MRKTMKLIRACEIIAAKYGKTIAHVLSTETSAENVYAELRGDGWSWLPPQNVWALMRPAPGKPIEKQEPARLPVSVRIMGEDVFGTEVAADHILDALKKAGAVVYKVSDAKPNHTGEGARVYVELGL